MINQVIHLRSHAFPAGTVQDYLILAHPQADLPQIEHAEEITHGDKEEISTGKPAPVEFPSLFY